MIFAEIRLIIATNICINVFLKQFICLTTMLIEEFESNFVDQTNLLLSIKTQILQANWDKNPWTTSNQKLVDVNILSKKL